MGGETRHLRRRVARGGRKKRVRRRKRIRQRMETSQVMQVSHKISEYRKNNNLFNYNCPSLCKVKTDSLSLRAETPLTSVAPLLSSLPPRLLNQSKAPLQAHLLSLLFFSYPTSIFLLALNFRPTYIAKEAQPANRYTIERRKESLDVSPPSNQSCLLLSV